MNFASSVEQHSRRYSVILRRVNSLAARIVQGDTVSSDVLVDVVDQLDVRRRTSAPLKNHNVDFSEERPVQALL